MPLDSDCHEIGPEDLENTSLRDLIAAGKRMLCITGADFSGEDLSRLDLRSTKFDRCLFSGTDFTGSDLSQTSWRSCRAAHAVFRSCILEEARFHGSDLNNSDWQRSKLSQAEFDGCKLTGANFSNSSNLGLSFKDCVLRSAYLSGMSFYKTELFNLDFTDADLSHCDFRYAVFTKGGSLSMARVINARFDNADLREASLQGFHLEDAKLFKGATISKSQATMLLSSMGLQVM